MINILSKRSVLFASIFLITLFTAYSQWQLGNYAGRTWKKIKVPNTLCGDSITPYSFFFSPAISDTAKYRLTVYFPGGGSTQIKSDSNLSTNLKSLQLLRSLLGIPAVSPASNELIFMDRPENDLFVGEGNWAIFPYCTQDMYIGRREDAQIYDFTETNGQSDIKAEIELLMNVLGWSADSVEKKFPPVKIRHYSTIQNSLFATPAITIDTLEIPVLHRGALNVELAFNQLMDSLIGAVPDFINHAEVIVSGGSAGSYGALYNFYHFGDLLYDETNTRLTLVHMAGFPVEKVWNDELNDLVFDSSRAVGIDYRFNFYQAARPCEIVGAAYSPGVENNCNDVLDIFNHYRNERYPGKDILFVPLVNKQDFVITSSLFKQYEDDYNRLTDELMNFCKTLHAYGYYFDEMDNVYPYLIWMYIKGFNNFKDYYGVPIKPEHVPQEAALLQHIQQPNGVDTVNEYNILEFINRVAARQLEGIKSSNIEFMPNVLLDYSDTGSGLVVYPDCFDSKYGDCNVIPQLFSGMQKIKEKSPHFSLDYLYAEEDDLSIVFSTGKEISLNLTVFDIAGRVQKEIGKFTYAKGVYTLNIDISSFSSGFYFCRLASPQKAYTEKFIVVQ